MAVKESYAGKINRKLNKKLHVIDVAAGAIDSPTGLRLQGHIFVADKGDYYEIADGLPQDAREP